MRHRKILSGCMIILLLSGIAVSLFAMEDRGKIIRYYNRQEEEVGWYEESHALIIGVSQYTHGWRSLPGVKEDVNAVKNVLISQGFNVEVVENPKNRLALDEAFHTFIQKYGHKPGNRLLFYFAGHGHTEKLAYGGSMGYIVPAEVPHPDRDKEGFLGQAMDMQMIEVYARRIQSKHALFLFDSCFSGSVFKLLPRGENPAITYRTAQPVRQIITSGSADESVPDESIFRKQFVEALHGAGDMNDDGYVSGTELGEFLFDTVTNYSKGAQHPQHGKIRDPFLDKGDFVFKLTDETLDVFIEEKTPTQKPEKTGTISSEVKQPLGDVYALIIGIDDYQDERIPELRYTVNDAQGFYDVLTDSAYRGVPKDQIRLLLGQDATYRNIKYAIGNWLSRYAKKEDTVIIFYSGHGVSEGDGTYYWVTYDANIDDLWSTALSNNDITDMLDRIKSKRIITFLDSCYDEATVMRKNQTENIITEIPLEKFTGEGRVVISASDGKQPGVEFDKYQHGVFTYYLLEGLKGEADDNNDGVVVIDEIWDYVKYQVPVVAQKAGSSQTPALQGRISSGIPLTLDMPKMRRMKFAEFLNQGKIRQDQYDCALEILNSGKSDPLIDGLILGKISEEVFHQIFQCDPQKEEVYAVIIGISDYQDERIPDLRYAVNDAQGFYDLLTNPAYGGVPKDHIKLLLDQDVTDQNIKYAIGTWLRQQVKERDIGIIYYSGHGAPEGEQETYWVTYNANVDDLYATALSNNDIANMLDRVKSKRVIIFLDSAFGEATVRRTNQAGNIVTEIPLDKFTEEGRIVISASQFSYELDEYQHGVFTYYLLEGLKGKADKNWDGAIGVGEAWDYVKVQVSDATRKAGNHQIPVMQGRLSSEIPLTRPGKERVTKVKLQELLDQEIIEQDLYDCAVKIANSGKPDPLIDGFMSGQIAKELFGQIFRCESDSESIPTPTPSISSESFSELNIEKNNSESMLYIRAVRIRNARGESIHAVDKVYPFKKGEIVSIAVELANSDSHDVEVGWDLYCEGIHMISTNTTVHKAESRYIVKELCRNGYVLIRVKDKVTGDSLEEYVRITVIR